MTVQSFTIPEGSTEVDDKAQAACGLSNMPVLFTLAGIKPADVKLSALSLVENFDTHLQSKALEMRIAAIVPSQPFLCDNSIQCDNNNYSKARGIILPFAPVAQWPCPWPM